MRVVLREILVAGALEFLPRRVADFLRAEARRRLGALVTEKAAQADLRPSRVAVKDTRSRWGELRRQSQPGAFSWRLVMAPRFDAGIRGRARGRRICAT